MLFLTELRNTESTSTIPSTFHQLIRMNEEMETKTKGLEHKDHRGRKEVPLVCGCVFFIFPAKKQISSSLLPSWLLVLVLSLSRLVFFVATNVHYRRAIIKAIEELQDFNLRSNIDAIRRHVQSSFLPEHQWNDTLFHKTLKTLITDGDIEQCTNLNCGFSPEFKRRRTHTIETVLDKRHSIPPLPPSHTQPTSPRLHPYLLDKEAPKRKPEHAKVKIIPKKEYDKLQ